MTANTHSLLKSSSFTIDKGLFHLVIAVTLLPGYFTFGPEFKFLVIPYVFYLVLVRRAAYLPAVLVHFLAGTLVSQVILIACGLLTLINFNVLRRLRLRGVFVMTLAPFPLLIVTAVESGGTAVEMGRYLSLYLGLFAFYYGSLVAGQVDDTVVKRIIWVLCASALLEASQWTDSVVRYYFLAVPILVVTGAGLMLPRAKWKLSVPLYVAATVIIGLLIADALQVTFIILFSTLIAATLVLARLHWTRALKGVPIGKTLVMGAVLLTTYIAVPDGPFYSGDTDVGGLDSIEQVADVLPALKYKLLGDRGALWKGTWETVREQDSLLPPNNPARIVFRTGDGLKREVGYGAHNVGLEFFRIYGWVTGFVGIISYLSYVAYMMSALVRADTRELLFPMLACVTAVAFVGGLFGHFVLNNNFSLLLLALGGVGHARFSKPLSQYPK